MQHFAFNSFQWFSGTFWSKKRVRTENPLRSIQKDHQKILKTKKVRGGQSSKKCWSKIFEIKNFRIFSISFFIHFWMKISENFEIGKFSKIFEFFIQNCMKKSKFSKILDHFFRTLTTSNFFRFQNFLMIFLYRSKWIFRADSFFWSECPGKSLEGIKRKMLHWAH